MQEEGKIEFLTTSGHKGFVLGFNVDVLIPPEHIDFFTNAWSAFILLGKSEVKFISLELLIKRSSEVKAPTMSTDQDFGFFGYEGYHTLDSIYAYLHFLAEVYPDIAEVFDLDGTTYEGRKIKAIRITNDIRNATSSKKPLVWLDGGTHSREWISPATVMYIADALTGDVEHEKRTKVATLRDTFQFVIAPVINPDGYEYTKFDRYWRKNRKPSGCRFNMRDCDNECIVEECYGSDPNRNWDVNFGVLGSSTDPCDISYPGAEPFDQECVQIVRDYLIEEQATLKLYINYHSYSQLFLYPWGYTREVPIHNEHHTKVGEAFVDAVKSRTGMHYFSHRIVEIHQDHNNDLWYDVSGTSIDWVYKNLGVVNSYGIELRDTGKENFKLSPDQILPTGQENFAGLIAILDIIG